MVLLLAAPVLFVLFLVVRDPFAAGEVLRSGSVWRVTLATLILGLAVTVSSITLATVLALLITRTRLLGGRKWLVGLALPLAFPSFLVAEAFRRATIVDGERLLDGYVGAWVTLTLITYPYALLPIEASLRKSSRELEYAARSLGYGPVSVFFRVTLAQIRTAMEWSALLVFLYTISDFGAPVMLGVPVLTTAIYGRLSEFGMIEAAGLSLILAVLAVGCIYGITRVRRRDRGAVISDAHIEHAPEPGQRGRIFGSIVCALVFAVSVGVPGAMVLGWMVPAWQQSAGVGVIETSRGLLAGIWRPMWNSLSVSLITAALAVIACVPFLVLAHRSQATRGQSGAGRIGRLALIGFGLPGVIVGFAFARLGWQLDGVIESLFLSEGSPALFFLYQSMSLLIAAYLVRCVTESLGPAMACLNRLPIERIDAAHGLGASRARAWWKVGLPALWPGLLAGAGLSFLTVIKELPITLIARPTGFDTLATELYTNLDNSFHAAAAPQALAMVILSMGVVTALVAWQKNAG